jgi:hypothetical protein
MERRRATRIISQHDTTTGGMATAPSGERVVPEPQFPLGMRNAAMAYASSSSTDVAVHGGRPSRHVPAAGNLTATTNDDSYHGSASELPPATSHGYAEWDFSGVLDLVMFQRFLDAATTGSATPTTPAPETTTPRGECFVVVTNDQANAVNTAGAGDEEAPQNLGTGLFQDAGPSAPPPHRQGVPTSTRS